MKRVRKFLCLVGAAGLLGAMSNSVAAQSTGVGASNSIESTQPQAIETVVVTAEKKTENQQTVPISLAVFDGAKLEDLHATSLEGLQGYIPNVEIGNYINNEHSADFTIRGRGIQEADPYAGMSVVVVDDGVPQEFNMVALLDTYDIDQVEVLRGPQGTLFGANADSGVIQVTSRQADTSQYSLDAEAGAGTYDWLEGNAAINVPIIADQLALRVTVMHEQREGFLTNIVNDQPMGDQNHTGIRAQLRYEGADNFDATLLTEVSIQRDGGQAVVNASVPGDAFYIPAGTVFPNPAYPRSVESDQPMYASPCVSSLLPCKAPADYLSGYNGYTPDTSDLNSYAASLTMNWHPAIGQFTSISGYKNFSLTDFHDEGWSPADLYDIDRFTKGWQFTQEVRGSFDPTPWLNVLVGGFYTKWDYLETQDGIIQYALPGLRRNQFNAENNDSISGFVQSYWKITDRLTFQAGGRFNADTSSMNVDILEFLDSRGYAQFRGYPENLTAGPTETLLSSAPVSGQKTWTSPTGKVGLNYDAWDNAMLYTTLAQGYKSGGFDGRISVPSDIGPFNNEYADTAEVGAKTEWLDHTLRVNLDGFYTDYRNLQVEQTYIVPNSGGLTSGTIQNAASATGKGFEAEVVSAPAAVEGLTLNGSVGYLDAQYTQFAFLNETTNTVEQLKGYFLQESPKWTLSLGANYTFPIGGYRAVVGVQDNLRTKQYDGDLTDSPNSTIQPINLVDLNLDISPENEKYTLGLWVRNLFDLHYISNMTVVPPVLGEASYGAPRTMGISLKVKM